MQKLKNNDELLPILTSVGIKAKEYANPSSVGVKGTFVIGTESAGRGILIRNTPTAKIEIATNEEKRQAVLNIVEEPLNSVRKVKVTLTKEEIKAIGTNIHSYVVTNKLRNNFPVYIPGANLSVANVKISKKLPDGKAIVSGDVRASMGRKREISFLIGMDETSHFISVLPKKVKTVEEAHESLKPKNLPKVAGIKRQGEFFFVPTTNEVVEEFMKQTKKEVRRSVPLEKDSNHVAQYAIPVAIRKVVKRHAFDSVSQNDMYQKGTHFVRGLIYDKRGYRHAPTDLGETWHTVMRNEEKRPPRAVARRYD